MVRSVTAQGRSGRTVTSDGARIETVLSVSGGGSGRIVRGRGHRVSITGVGAATLTIFMAALAASSSPIGVDVTGTASGTLSMGASGRGAFSEAYTGTGSAIIPAMSGSAVGVVVAPVTGTGDATLAIFSGSGVGSGNYPSGTGDATLILTADGAGQHIFPVTAVGASVLALTATATGRADQLVAGAGSKVLSLTGAGVGTAGAGPGAVVPASIATPVQGSDLTYVWNLKDAGTGPLNSLSNGAWSGSLDAYLIARGFSWANGGGALYWNVGTSAKSVSRYDFTGAPPIYVNGSTPGSGTFTDCVFAGAADINGPTDINGTHNYDSGTLAVTVTNCTLDASGFFMGSGTWNFNYCRFKNQRQALGNVGFLGLGVAVLNYDHCYITGGGIAPTWDAHVELTQMARNAVGCSFSCTNTLIDISHDGQTTAAPWNSGWTGVWAVVGDYASAFTNSIMIGSIAVNANPANPNVVSCLVAYNTGSTPTLTNCVMETGINGYTKNQQGTATRPADGGGNRSFANAALTSANFN